VQGKEGVQQLLEADLCGVKVELDDLGVTGGIGADVLVAGLFQLAAFIADGG
jgi:hypothetical protein